jgi:hypothetical protein
VWLEVRLLPRILLVAAGLVSWCWLDSVPAALAFSEPSSYPDEAIKGGGGGRWFTGSPADGYGCDVCHTGAPSQPNYPLYAAGFPEGGYVPGQTYELQLRWPEFAAQDTAVRAMQGAEPTSMGLVAEFVSESGIGSGVVEVPRRGAADTELCVFPPRGVSTAVHSVRPGEKAKVSARCESKSLGERCVLAVRSCGAQEVRFSWTAPPQYEDVVWFSAGFVATDRLSTTPASDSVALFSTQLVTASSDVRGYESVLEGGGCSISTRSLDDNASVLFAMALALLWLARRTGSCVRLAGVLSALAAASACSSDSDAPPGSSGTPLAGLYVPQSPLGVPAPAKEEEAALSSPEEENEYFQVPPGDRCVGIDPMTPPGGAGTLKTQFTTISMDELWAPDNVGAVWIEDASQRYIKTLELWAGVRKSSLYKWGVRACHKPEPEVDVVTRATLPTHQTHEVSWNGKDLNGLLVPDGIYTLFIEVTETELNVGVTSTQEFEKSATPATPAMPVLLPPAEAPAAQPLTSTYTPMP